MFVCEDEEEVDEGELGVSSPQDVRESLAEDEDTTKMADWVESMTPVSSVVLYTTASKTYDPCGTLTVQT